MVDDPSAHPDLFKHEWKGAQGLAEDGILFSRAGKMRLLRPTELPADWDPSTDQRLTIWEMVHHLVRALESGGEGAAAALAAQLGGRAETARELRYRLYNALRAQEARRQSHGLQRLGTELAGDHASRAGATDGESGTARLAGRLSGL